MNPVHPPNWVEDYPNPTSANCDGGTAGGYGCDDVDFHSFTSLGDMGFSNAGSDMWGYTSPQHKDFAVVGSGSQWAFVDVSDANNPVVMANLAMDGSYNTNCQGNNEWADAKLIGQKFYLISTRYGSSVQVVDMQQFPTDSVEVDSTFNDGGNYTGAHNVYAFDGNLYAFWVSPGDNYYSCNSSGNYGTGNWGVVTFNAGGTKIGCMSHSTVWDAHDMACHDYGGSSKICIVAGGIDQMLTAMNVSNPGSPSEAWDHDTYMGGFIHQPAITADGGHMVVTNEFDATMNLRIHSISASGQSFLSTFATGFSGNEHQGYFYDAFYFLAAFNQGLLVFSWTGTTLSFKGQFDTTTSGNVWSGAWSTFSWPYTACFGNTYYKVAIADFGGFFLVQPDPLTVVTLNGPAHPCKTLEHAEYNADGNAQ